MIGIEGRLRPKRRFVEGPCMRDMISEKIVLRGAIPFLNVQLFHLEWNIVNLSFRCVQ